MGRTHKAERLHQERLQAICDQWNSAHPVGAEVVVLTDTKGPIFTRTRSEAQVLSGHTPVIWLEGISGCYDLERVKPRSELSAGSDSSTP